MAKISMPQLGETLTEGTVAKWLKREGDRVEKDEPVVEISTDKVDVEVPSPAEGKLRKIMVREGETVEVGAELASIEETGAQAPGVKLGEPVPAAKPGEVDRAGFVSPVVRRLAAEKGVDLSSIVGTGLGGRITKKDVLTAAEEMPAPARPEAVLPPPRRAVAPAPRAPRGRERIEKLSPIRKAIAAHILKSARSTAAVTAIVEVDMENVASQRALYKEEFKRREGFSLTYLPFVSLAVIDALRNFPRFNAELRNDELIIKDYIDLSIAVDRPEGLISPVIAGADSLNLVGLARAIHEIAVKARAGRLTPAEAKGGTFTITNPGSTGSIIQTPIINGSQAAILSLEKIEERVVPVDGSIAVRKMVYTPLTYDHRVVDGADAARFLVHIKNFLEKMAFGVELSAYARREAA